MAILRSNKAQSIKLVELNPFITCELCEGYLIKPTTIAECLHTFCRSCIVQNLQDNEENICPRCSTVIHETNPFEMLRSDQMLEDIIFKLVPGLQERERRCQEEFNKAVRSGKRDINCLKNRHKESIVDEPPQKKYRSLSRKADHSDDSDGKHNFHRDDPQIGVCLQYLRDCIEEEPVYRETNTGSRVENAEAEKLSESSRKESLNGSMWELVRKYIRCSSRTTIGHIKKYLKLKLNLSAVDQVEVMCNGEIMGKDHTLEFVFMTRWRVKDNTILTLQYRPKLDFL
ncbi:Polycomb group RING finger protein 5 [Desmophyllum pertusum]|uniref:Polycomb group RING finger protein 5 n=1 Tax=Desmophyllum pertusum TaxID=174260 RepID=A0A9X0A2U1_9CNID|nr:Polycomb group RING finger protein 5 [Desmophyllum pertusum]